MKKYFLNWKAYGIMIVGDYSCGHVILLHNTCTYD